MTYHEYPNIRVYGFWGLLITNAKEETKVTYRRLKSDDGRFMIIGFSDVIDECSVAKYCKLLKRGKIKL